MKFLFTLLSVALILQTNAYGHTEIKYNTIDKSINNVKSIEEYDEKFTYLEVLQNYYQVATLNIDNPSKTFEQFYNDYYSEDSDRDLYKFTIDLAKENGNYNMVHSLFYGTTDTNLLSTKSSISEDADYILSYNSEYLITPNYAFKRHFLYSFFNYKDVQAGDIVWETETELFNTGHNAIIINPKQASDYGDYIQTIEAVYGGIQRGFLDDYRMTKYKCKILRVKGRTDSNASKAVEFAKLQLGKPYSLDIHRVQTDIDSPHWYCSELVYACWYYAGIDLGLNRWLTGFPKCLPADIGHSSKVSEITLLTFRFVNFAIRSKEGQVWTIDVYNSTPERRYIEYTASFCYTREVENWQGVYNVAGRYISSYSYLMLEMKEYMGEDAIGASYILNNTYRIITYANNLDEKNKTLDKYYNIVKI